MQQMNHEYSFDYTIITALTPLESLTQQWGQFATYATSTWSLLTVNAVFSAFTHETNALGVHRRVATRSTT